MGYSCTQAAGDTLAYIENHFQDPTTNTLQIATNSGRYFFERGDERADGAIIGKIYRISDKDTNEAQFAGIVMISADGMIKRFPALHHLDIKNINADVAAGKIPRATPQGL